MLCSVRIVKLKVVGQWTCSFVLYHFESFAILYISYISYIYSFSLPIFTTEWIIVAKGKTPNVHQIVIYWTDFAWNVCFTREFIDITSCWLQLKMHSNSDLIRPNSSLFACWNVLLPTVLLDCRTNRSANRRLWYCKTFRDTNLSNYRVSSYLLHFSFLDSQHNVRRVYVFMLFFPFVSSMIATCYRIHSERASS